MLIELAPCVSATTSPLTRFKSAAVAGDSSAALSQVSFVSDFGNSCSQALFANRPSYTLGSGRKTTSNPAAADAVAAPAIAFACTATVLGANAVLGITPSCSHRRQSRSNAETAPATGAACGTAAPTAPSGVEGRPAVAATGWRGAMPSPLQNARTSS